MDIPQTRFTDFDGYKTHVLSANNLSEAERNQSFWDWVVNFPEALRQVLQSPLFDQYFQWETAWLDEQNDKHRQTLRNIRRLLSLCKEHFPVSIPNIQLIINPIKCAYSADYYLKDRDFIFCSGALREDSVVHELIHPVAHPVIERHRDEILRCKLADLGLDASYCLDNDPSGILNAFEEHFVRTLTHRIVRDAAPDDLDGFLRNLLRQSSL